MPSDNTPAQQPQRPGLGSRRSTSAGHIQTIHQTGSPATTTTAHAPPAALHHNKTKGHKHVVSTGRLHSRVSSSKAVPKLAKPHANEGSYTDMKRLTKNSSSATNLKKNSSHANLRRNRSSADVPKRVRDEQLKRPVSVHFEIGDQDQEDGWEETSSTASPTLARSVSRSAVSSNPSSAKPSANNSQAQSPVHPHPPVLPADGGGPRPNSRPSTEGRIITERLLQRTPSQHTTKMSLATATQTSASYLPEDVSKGQDSPASGTPKVGSKEVVSRFVAGSGTPSDGSPFLHHRKPEPEDAGDDVKRVRSMGNLGRPASTHEDDDESALVRRSRHPSQTNAYIPPQQSRTQQKLWLQRASSNIEPQQMAPGAMNGLAGLHGSRGAPSLVDADAGGRDPRTRLQLERTGLEYLVVRRHQDPVGAALTRLQRLPGMERFRRIPGARRPDDAARFGLSQSLREGRARPADKAVDGARSSFDAQPDGPDTTEDGTTALLRSIWEKSFDLSASAE
jgi:hypothetical protein